MSLLDSVIAIAEEAAKSILEVYGREDFGTTHKADASPLTEADRSSHERIVQRLTALDPATPVLSEESEAAAYDVRRGWSRFWLVDPLDGTREFVGRNGEFTVNIALIEAGRPVLGVVHAPVLRWTYWAAAGSGAHRKLDGQPAESIAVSDYRTCGLRVVASRSHAGPLVPRLLAALGDPPCVSKGSSLKFCLIADGTANLYPRLGPTMEWDVAAAAIIVAEAGGHVTDLYGRPLAYNKPDLRNPPFIATGEPPYPWPKVVASLDGGRLLTEEALPGSLVVRGLGTDPIDVGP